MSAESGLRMAHTLVLRMGRGRSSRLSWGARHRVTALLGLLMLATTLGRADPPPATQGAVPRPEIDTVTVEARRRKELEREVEHFVLSVTGHPRGESVPRWDTPVCPLVAGLPRNKGEFILVRLSQIAREVHAPLAGEQCAVNFYVVVSAEPGVLLKKWYARDPRMFSTRNGRGAVNSFLGSRHPVRVWYNSDILSEGGMADSPNATTAGLVGTGLDTANLPVNAVPSGTRLRHGAVWGLSSVIIVLDANRLEGLTFGELADYVAMIGLAQVQLDAQPGAAPTILTLFDSPDTRPAALSRWDEAFLSSLYQTDQKNVTQLSEMEHHMLDSIAH